jgi:hypothetical protein
MTRVEIDREGKIVMFTGAKATPALAIMTNAEGVCSGGLLTNQNEPI